MSPIAYLPRIREMYAGYPPNRWVVNQDVPWIPLGILANYGVGFVSIVENLDYSTPQGKLFTTMLAGLAEFYSDSLAIHVKKGVDGRALKGLHLGSLPFGYQSCYKKRQLRCSEEHPGAVHPVPQEAEAVRELFRRYFSGTVTLSQLASDLNSQGLRTRNTKKLPVGNGDTSHGPRLFTVASVRGILHNPFYTGRVRHMAQLLPGAHEPLVTCELFDTVQAALRRNSGRSETLHPRPEREYLLKGLIRCAHCLMPMWAQTYNNGHRYYREQYGSRGAGYCVGRSGSMPCHVPDDQMGKIVSAIVLPEAWMDRILARVHIADEVKRISQERKRIEEQLKRLREVYLEGDLPREEYLYRKRGLDDRLQSLVVPGVDAARDAGKLLEDLPRLWDQANLTERRRPLLSMLDAVYVDTIEEKSVVAITPKPAFMPLFEIATTKKGSGAVLISEKELPPDCSESPEATIPCLWWRRGRLHIPQLQTSPVIIPHRVPRSWAAYTVAWAA